MEWNEVKAKPKKQAKRKNFDDDEGHYGGTHHGHLMAGAIAHSGLGKTSVSKGASAVADADYLRDEDE
jgi:hypothetical protein